MKTFRDPWKEARALPARNRPATFRQRCFKGVPAALPSTHARRFDRRTLWNTKRSCRTHSILRKQRGQRAGRQARGVAQTSKLLQPLYLAQLSRRTPSNDGRWSVRQLRHPLAGVGAPVHHGVLAASREGYHVVFHTGLPDIRDRDADLHEASGAKMQKVDRHLRSSYIIATSWRGVVPDFQAREQPQGAKSLKGLLSMH